MVGFAISLDFSKAEATGRQEPVLARRKELLGMAITGTSSAVSHRAEKSGRVSFCLPGSKV